MKSIEERAYDFAMDEVKVEGFDFGSVKDGYVQGAYDQKAIDEKEMFAEREKAFNNGYEVAKKELIEKALEWLKMYDITFTQTPSMLEDFKKAMEE